MQLSALTLLVFLTTASAAAPPKGPSAPTKETCNLLRRTLPNKISLPSSRAYRAEQANYWSYACASTKPACIAHPTSPEEVSTILKVLNDSKDVPWTVKSGGHSPNVGHASINDGVLVALSKMKGVKVREDGSGLADVLPGGRWEDVIEPLEKRNLTAVGGRLGVVGIGGYLTGGGLSFLSAQYGMAADTITEFETVLPNGTVVKVNGDNHPGMFRAMKGSSNQFGVVTKFTMKTFPMNGVWGGNRIYSSSHIPQLLKAFHDFTENPVDPKAAIILTLEKIGSSEIPFMFYFYDGWKAPKGVFKQFEDIPAQLDGCKSRTYTDLLKITGTGSSAMGSIRTSFRSMTLPNVPGDQGAFQNQVYETWKAEHEEMREDAYGTITASLALQSFPNLIGGATEKAGGNAMGLKSKDGGRFIVELTYLWGYNYDDALIKVASKKITDAVEGKLTGLMGRYDAGAQTVVASGNDTTITTGAPKTLGRRPEAYLPYFLNDAMDGQPVLQSYDRYEEFKKIQAEIDPTGLLRRAGGFKYT